MTQAKALSKLFRVKLTDEIQELILSLPLEEATELHTEDHIYEAQGRMRIGVALIPIHIDINMDRSKDISLTVKSNYLELMCPFGTKDERNQAPKLILRAICEHFN